MSEKTCGLIALVGAPNVGKSTLMNALVGARVGITSSKANTTRIVVRGVLTAGDAQLIFMDTPGLNNSSKAFDRSLVQEARGALDDADIVALVIDAERGFDGRAKDVMARLKDSSQTAVLIINKIDKTKNKEALLPLMVVAQEAGCFADVVPVSSLKKRGLEHVVKAFVSVLPEGEWLFPADMVTDMPIETRLAELTREQVMRRVHEEIPYGVTVEPLSLGEAEDGVLEVVQNIMVAREKHKGILVGKGGEQLKELGTLARAAMGEALGRSVRLFLKVKVAK
ncbi:MAG: GTPase Era [Alphaproteobacteria bacterium CG_4_10_14_0_8_um_filter_53_9]|nr:MAG: GTPase Era [Alphaproteobacteria bacterium CG_4_10_14_0_8_um_filter_53_9]